MIAIRLGTDTAESRMPDAGDRDDVPLDRGLREERTGRDFFDDGKKQRFETLALQHLDAAYNLARWLVRNDEDANDIVQDAFLRAMRAFDGFRGDNARPWLLAIVRNTAFTWLRKNRPTSVQVPYEEDIHGDARYQVTVHGVPLFTWVPYIAGQYTAPSVIATAPVQSLGATN